MKTEETNSSVYKKKRRKKIAKETGKCAFCPPHSNENWRRKPKSDKHKNHR